MKWEYVRYGVQRYHDSSGKILGSATKGSDQYYASANGQALGSYISMESAMAAVEKAINGKAKGTAK